MSEWRGDALKLAFYGAMIVPDGPDDRAADAHNNYVRAVWFGKPVDGKTSREWRAEADRLYAEKAKAAAEGE